MLRSLLKSKIHRATVTQADLHYEGSLTIDAALLEAVDLHENEEVHVWNVTSGTRFSTYAMRGERGSGIICINGAGAHLAKVGELVIISAFGLIDDREARNWQPKVILLDEHNRIKATLHREVPGPLMREDPGEA